MKSKISLHASVAMMAMLMAGAAAAAEPAGSRDPAASETSDAEIVVTARKGREERLMDVPAAISAVTGVRLEQQGIRSGSQYLVTVPSVQLVEASPGQSTIVIRGASASYGEPTVGYYLDEIPFSNLVEPIAPDAGTFDVDRIEVLRGPQGTLYGAGSSGGVVRVLTKQPDLDKFEAKGDFSLSKTRFSGKENYDLNGVVNVPIVSDRVALRLGASYRRLGGVVDNPFLGTKDYDPQKYGTYRARLRAKLTDDLDVTGGVWLSRVSSEVAYGQFSRQNNAVGFNEPQRTDYDLFSLTVNYDGLDGATITSATSYLDYRAKRTNDLRSAPNPLFYQYDFDTHNFSQETRIASDRTGGFAWTVGGFYRNARTLNSIDIPAFAFAATTRIESEAYALFGEGTVFMADRKLEATLGLRWFHDDRSEVRVTNNTGGGGKFKALSPKVNLTWHVDDDRLAYFNFARGFRSGLIQPSSVLAFAQQAGVDVPATIPPESVWSYEVGFKGSFMGGRMTLEAAAYLNKVRNIQSLVALPQLPGLEGIVGGNRATVPGAELIIGLRPARGLSMSGSVSFNDGKYDTNKFNAFQVNDRISGVSRWTASLAGRYEADIADDVLGFVDYSLAYHSPQASPGSTSVTAFLPDSITDLRARIGAKFSRFEVSLFAENLLDEAGRITAAQRARPRARYLRPRTFGINLRFGLGGE